MPKTYTTRGFAVYDEIPDMYGGTVVVQESSNVEGGVWLFYRHPKNDEIDAKQPMGSKIMDPHLSNEQAQQVINAISEHLWPEHEQPNDDGAKRNRVWITKEQASCLLALLDVELRMAPLRADACHAFGYPDRYSVLVFADELRGVAEQLRGLEW